jgi:hypothetical protein
VPPCQAADSSTLCEDSFINHALNPNSVYADVPVYDGVSVYDALRVNVVSKTLNKPAGTTCGTQPLKDQPTKHIYLKIIAQIYFQKVVKYPI